MDNKEYNEVKEMDYDEFYNYLVAKYGHPDYNYIPLSYPLTKSGSSEERRLKRENEGLVEHHYYEKNVEDHELAIYETSVRYPMEYQFKENICFCDLLEHLLLHILIGRLVIASHPLSKETIKMYDLFAGEEIINDIMPLINDTYAGRFPSTDMFSVTIGHDKDIYFKLLKEFYNLDKRLVKRKTNWYVSTSYTKKQAKFSTPWDIRNGESLFKEISNYLGIPLKGYK